MYIYTQLYISPFMELVISQMRGSTLNNMIQSFLSSHNENDMIIIKHTLKTFQFTFTYNIKYAYHFSIWYIIHNSVGVI